MKVLVATDAWHPQVNGVVRTYERLALEAVPLGFEVSFLAPCQFRTVPLPTYPEIRLALASPFAIAKAVERERPDFFHIATEGPLGFLMRSYCRKHGLPFTTSYHTRFPDYVRARLPIPESWCYALQRRFHNSAAGTFVATHSLKSELAARGFNRLMLWSRGVDTGLFRPRRIREFGDGPVFLYVGRIAIEKNIEAFLDLDLPGKKVVVGSGPQSAELARKYPDVCFTGPRQGDDLARAYASADVFVFPSLTDTFGLVLLEALASGVPVAAFPVSGPLDVITDPSAGALNQDLREAALAALELDPDAARNFAEGFSWENSARQFLENMLVAHHAELPKVGRWRRKKKTARSGGDRAVSLSCVSLGDAKGGTSRPPRDGEGLLEFQEAPSEIF
jgi:glycosyltransferase involved in cell wall biosynthesis